MVTSRQQLFVEKSTITLLAIQVAEIDKPSHLMKGLQGEASVFVEESTVLGYALQVVTDSQFFAPFEKPKVPLSAVLTVEIDRPFHTIAGPQIEALEGASL